MPAPPPTSITNAKFILSTPKWKGVPADPLAQICFVGRSNVGKSSLINLLVGQTRLAKTSSTPGRTQHVVLFHAEFRREGSIVPFHLVDLPGYGYAKVPRELQSQWRPMTEGFFIKNPYLACCVFLLDIRRVPSDDDVELLDMMHEFGTPVLPVVTKTDKVPKTKRPAELKKISETLGFDDWRDLRPVSVTERFGQEALLAELYDVVQDFVPPTPVQKSPE